MSKVTVVVSRGGARALLNSAGVQALLLTHAERAASVASGMTGEVFTADVRPGKNRAHAMAKTSGIESIRANAKTNALLKGLS